jgi:type IV pilus assembly protein PilW
MSKMSSSFSAHSGQRGLSLIELMIAMVIGLMTVLAISALVSGQARQQRLGGSINDAQNNAIVAISMVEKDLQQAGAGMVSEKVRNCNRLFTSINTGAGASAIDNFDISGVTIVNGSGSSPDRLIVRSAESVRGEASLPLIATMTNAIDDVRVANTFGMRDNDLMLISNAANDCTLAQITSMNVGVTNTVLVTAATASSSNTSPTFNPASLPSTWTATYPSPASQAVILGRFTQRTYSVNTATVALDVRVQGSLNVGTTSVVENIVDLQAQYGITADAASDTITAWEPATGIWAYSATTPSAADRKRIKAVRFAVVARTGELDTSNPTSAGNLVLWPQATTGQTSTTQTYAISAGQAQQYRYRVLRMVVPLKNMLWGSE